MTDAPGPLRDAAGTVAIASVLFGGKIAAAWASGSVGLLSTAVDSGLDVLMSLVVVGGIFLARQPADRDHPYGHGKFESVTGLLEAGILAGVGVILAFYGVLRIQNPEPITLDLWVVAVLVATMLVGAERGWRLSRAGETHRSPALSVDAWHYTSDVVTAGLALVGAYLTTLGYPWADGASAVVVGGVLFFGSIHVGRRATADLVDQVPPRLTTRVEETIEAVENVEAARQVRVREAGPDIFVDATVEVPRAMGIERAHEVMDEVERAVEAELGEADITVHAEPVAARESVATTLEVIASREPAVLGIHEIFVDRLGDELVVDCHVEVDEDLSLEEAHGIAQAFEARAKEQIPDVTGVRTHIEPIPRDPREGEEVTDSHADVVDRIERAAGQAPFEGGGEVVLKRAGGRLEAIVTVYGAPDLSLHTAHEAADKLELDILGSIEGLDRVVVHVEPEDAP